MSSSSFSKTKAMEGLWRRGSLLELASSPSVLRWQHSWRRSDSNDLSSSSSSLSSTSSSFSSTPSPPTSAEQSRRGSASADWRASAHSVSWPAKPLFKDLKLGLVLRLDEPDQASVLKQALAGSNQVPWHHPVVIIGKQYRNGKEMVTFRVCTSFNGQGLELGRRSVYHHQYVLAENQEDNTPPHGTHLASMATGCSGFKKRTYICLNKESVLEVEYDWLAMNGKNEQRFDDDATQRLVYGMLDNTSYR